MTLLDTDQLHAMAGGAPELLLPILDDFHESAQQSLGTLPDLLHAGKLAEAGEIFHQLKGASGTLGLRALYESCHDLERTANDGGSVGIEVLTTLSAVLEDSVAEARQILGSRTLLPKPGAPTPND